MTSLILAELLAQRRAEQMRAAEEHRRAAQVAHRTALQPPRARKLRWWWPHLRAARGSTAEDSYHPAVPAAPTGRA
jgi:hypothetical protein